MIMEKTKDIKQQLLEAIEQSGLTRADIAKQVDPVNHKTVEGLLSRFVRGQRSISLNTASKICEVLGLELKPMPAKAKKTKKSK